jgi:hypothetical protein
MNSQCATPLPLPEPPFAGESGGLAAQARPARQVWSSVEGKLRLVTIEANSPSAALQSHNRTFSRELAILGVVLAIIQVLDGVLTAIGVARFGVHAEGNIALRLLMSVMGHTSALILVKLIALSVILLLCLCGPRIRWLSHAFRGIIAVYVLAAIIPWSIILTSEALGL